MQISFIMKKLSFCLLLVILSQLITFGTADAAARQCQVYFNSEKVLNSKAYSEVLDISAVVETTNGVKVGNSLASALEKPEVKELLRATHRSYEILLTAKLPVIKGGGTLRLVVLNQRASNLAYNHVELTALLKVNPELANEIGFYRIEGEDNLVWAPDVKTVNFRLKKMAQKFGYKDGVWGYDQAAGVVDTMPYLNLLANGKFPFSGDADVNLSVHDSLHAVAFAVLNVTPGGRKVLEAAKSRNQIVLKINERLSTEVGGYYANNFIRSIATFLGSDAMERTMLLTIVLTGNHDYFSASKVRENNSGNYFTKQNKETTLERITELLKLFNYSHKTFEQALDMVAPVGDPNREKIKTIFIEEISTLKSASLAQINSAAKQIMKFMPDDLFSDTARAGSVKNSKLENHDPAGIETLH